MKSSALAQRAKPVKSPLPIPAERKPDYSRLSRAELASLFALHRAGKNQVEIAQALSCNVSTVCRWLADLGDTTELAKQTLRSKAQTFAERVVKKADVEQSLEVLDRLGVAERRQTGSGHALGVQVIVNVPNSPTAAVPILAGNVIADYQTQNNSEGESNQ